MNISGNIIVDIVEAITSERRNGESELIQLKASLCLEINAERSRITLEKEVEQLKEWRHEVKPGEVCYYCQEKIEEYVGNPSKWPLYFSHKEEPGKVKPHHVGCTILRLETIKSLEKDLEMAREALEYYAEFFKGKNGRYRVEDMDKNREFSWAFSRRS